MNEEGDILQGYDNGKDDGVDPNQYIIIDDKDEVSHVLEDAQPELHGFAEVTAMKTQNDVRDMFNIQQSKQFQAVNKITEYAIRKTVDVRRLKYQMLDVLQQQLVIPNQSVFGDQQVTGSLTNLMSDLYYGQRKVSQKDVSIQTAFICLLHLANEQNLSLEAQSECDFKITKPSFDDWC